MSNANRPCRHPRSMPANTCKISFTMLAILRGAYQVGIDLSNAVRLMFQYLEPTHYCGCSLLAPPAIHPNVKHTHIYYQSHQPSRGHRVFQIDHSFPPRLLLLLRPIHSLPSLRLQIITSYLSPSSSSILHPSTILQGHPTIHTLPSKVFLHPPSTPQVQPSHISQTQQQLQTSIQTNNNNQNIHQLNPTPSPCL